RAGQILRTAHRRPFLRRHQRPVHRPCVTGSRRRRRHRAGAGRRHHPYRHPAAHHRTASFDRRTRTPPHANGSPRWPGLEAEGNAHPARVHRTESLRRADHQRRPRRSARPVADRRRLMRSILMPWLSALITSQGLRDLNRRRAELRRRLTGQPHVIDVWLRVDDPYSWLLIQVLPAFAAHFGVQVRPHVMLYLDAQMYPHPELLGPLAARDAAALAALHGLDFPRDAALPDHERSLLTTAMLLRHEQDPAFFSIAAEVFSALWHGHDLTPLAQAHAPLPLDQTRLAMEARRDSYLREGHYLSAMLRYGGEWYWGIDRLDHG